MKCMQEMRLLLGRKPQRRLGEEYAESKLDDRGAVRVKLRWQRRCFVLRH